MSVNHRNIGLAVHRLRPGAAFMLEGDELAGLTWLDQVLQRPTDQELTTECAAVQAEYDAAAPERSRQREHLLRGVTPAVMVEALWRQVVENDNAQVLALQVTREQVQAEYPDLEQD